jgi:hypothetical protein
VRAYTVDIQCPSCNRMHRVTDGLLLRAGPAELVNLGNLIPSSDLPPVLPDLLNDKVWCDSAGDYVEMPDRWRVLLKPAPRRDGTSQFPGDMP